MRTIGFSGSQFLLESARKRKRDEENSITQTHNEEAEAEIAEEVLDDDGFDEAEYLDTNSETLGEEGRNESGSLDANVLIQRLLHVAQEGHSVTETASDDVPVTSEVTTNQIPSSSVTSTPTIEEAPTAEFIETFDLQDEDVIDIQSMPPPRRRSSVPELEDKSEDVPQTCSDLNPDVFQMAFGLWCQDAAITRQQYSSLLDVLALLQDKAQVDALPKSVETLRRKTRSHLPLVKVRKQRIPLIAAKLPTAGRAFSTTLTDWFYWFDPAHLITTLLASTEFQAKMHIGMAEFVDSPKELWHSQSWGASIGACSGNFAYCDPPSNNQPIFPSDVVYYMCANKACSYIHLGRVYTVGRDLSKYAVKPGEITLQVQALRRVNELDQSWQSIFALNRMKFPLQPKELVCIEDEFHYVLQEDVVSIELNVCLDYLFDDLHVIDPQIGRHDTLTSPSRHRLASACCCINLTCVCGPICPDDLEMIMTSAGR